MTTTHAKTIRELSEELRVTLEKAAERGLLQDVLAFAAEDYECSGFADELKEHGNIRIKSTVHENFASLTISEGGAHTVPGWGTTRSSG